MAVQEDICGGDGTDLIGFSERRSFGLMQADNLHLIEFCILINSLASV
jgi:hypothetical protein